jgi:hypothetical protein
MSRFASRDFGQGNSQPAISEEEATAFAMAITKAVSELDYRRLFELVDWERILDRATSVPRLPELDDARQLFKERALTALKRSAGVHGEIHKIIEQGGTYKVLHTETEGDNPSVLFRLNGPDGGGLNYHRYSLVRNGDGTVVADDMFVFLTAQELSHGLRRGWFLIAKANLQTADPEFADREDPFFAHVDEIQALSTLDDQQKHAELLDVYRALPEPLRKDRTLMILALAAAKHVSDESSIELIHEFRRTFPHEPAVDLILMDEYLMRQKYGLALQCVDRLDVLVGGDPLLSAKRALCLLELGRIAEARRAIDKTIAEEPDEFDGYSIGLDVALAERNFDDVAEYLTILEDSFGVEWDDLRESEDFVEFRKSAQYEAWLKAREE